MKWSSEKVVFNQVFRFHRSELEVTAMKCLDIWLFYYFRRLTCRYFDEGVNLKLGGLRWNFTRFLFITLHTSKKVISIFEKIKEILSTLMYTLHRLFGVVGKLLSLQQNIFPNSSF